MIAHFVLKGSPLFTHPSSRSLRPLAQWVNPVRHFAPVTRCLVRLHAFIWHIELCHRGWIASASRWYRVQHLHPLDARAVMESVPVYLRNPDGNHEVRPKLLVAVKALRAYERQVLRQFYFLQVRAVSESVSQQVPHTHEPLEFWKPPQLRVRGESRVHVIIIRHRLTASRYLIFRKVCRHLLIFPPNRCIKHVPHYLPALTSHAALLPSSEAKAGTIAILYCIPPLYSLSVLMYANR